MGEYTLPADTVEQKIRSGIGAFWKKFEAREPEPEAPVQAEGDLQGLSPGQMGSVAPDPVWTEAVEVLEARLSDWLADEPPARPVIFLVSPPHAFREEILAAWAMGRGWRILESPDPRHLLAGEEEWIPGRFDGVSNWVFPRLEDGFLRHAGSLGPVRRILDDLCAGRLGRGIVGCDSWAWAFLTRIWRGRSFAPIAVQAFDAGRLERWFGDLSAGAGRRRLDFRHPEDGRYVLPPLPENEDEKGKTPRSSGYLQHLAAWSRGIPGIALALWRKSLRIEWKRAGENGGGATEETGQRSAPDSTVWIAPWEAEGRPGLPAETDRDLAFAAHALLLHNGLPGEILTRILPLSPSRTRQALSLLEDCGAAAETEGIWRITALGYPAVREFLKNEGYLTDRF